MSKDRVVVVTGGASGIGLGITQAFARNGHPVAMLDLQDEALERESKALQAAGARVLARKVDVSNRQQIDAAYAEIRKELGPITVVVANAGISFSGAFKTLPVETWQKMLDVNLTGVFHTVQAAISDMLDANWGRIITVSSHAGQSGAQDRAHYSASKAGVIGLTQSLAREFGRFGITSNTIAPSLVDTPLAREGERSGQVPPLEVIAKNLPIPRPGTPEDIAAACVFLASEGACYVTGQQINVNGGSRI